jgi:pimeloyl-ACP methyl ester carboxylesterase
MVRVARQSKLLPNCESTPDHEIACTFPFFQPTVLFCSVSDLPTLGRVTIDEAKALIDFIERSGEFGPIVLTGNSMGGLHSAMTAALTPSHELGVVSWLGPPTADHVFCMVCGPVTLLR